MGELKKRRPIPKSRLRKSRYYLGNGRNSDIGYWTGEVFLTIGKKFDQWLVKYEPYEKGNMCFVPFELINDTKYHPERERIRKMMEKIK